MLDLTQVVIHKDLAPKGKIDKKNEAEIGTLNERGQKLFILLRQTQDAHQKMHQDIADLEAVTDITVDEQQKRRAALAKDHLYLIARERYYEKLLLAEIKLEWPSPWTKIGLKGRWKIVGSIDGGENENFDPETKPLSELLANLALDGDPFADDEIAKGEALFTITDERLKKIYLLMVKASKLIESLLHQGCDVLEADKPGAEKIAKLQEIKAQALAAESRRVLFHDIFWSEISLSNDKTLTSNLSIGKNWQIFKTGDNDSSGFDEMIANLAKIFENSGIPIKGERISGIQIIRIGVGH